MTREMAEHKIAGTFQMPCDLWHIASTVRLNGTYLNGTQRSYNNYEFWVPFLAKYEYYVIDLFAMRKKSCYLLYGIQDVPTLFKCKFKASSPVPFPDRDSLLLFLPSSFPGKSEGVVERVLRLGGREERGGKGG